MNKLRSSFLLKTLAVLLLAAACFVMLGAVVGLSYIDGGVSPQTVFENTLRGDIYDLLIELQGETDPRELYLDNSFKYELLDEEGRVLFSNKGESATEVYSLLIEVGRFFYRGEMDYYYNSETDLVVSRYRANAAPEGFVRIDAVRGHLLTIPEGSSVYNQIALYQFFTTYAPLFWPALCLSALAALACFLFLLSAAGHRDGSGAVKASFIEQVPFDLLSLGLGAAIWSLLYAAGETFSFDLGPEMAAVALFLLAAGLLLLLWCMSFAVRVKLGCFWESFLSLRIVRWCWNLLVRLVKGLGYVLRGLPFIWRGLLIAGGFALVELLWIVRFWHDQDMMTMGWFFKWIALFVILGYVLLGLRRLRQGAKDLASGKLEAGIELKHLYGELKAHGEDLNRVRDGVNAAVNERMKSERFRTELITNVSHDIKTPLTSIINYVDLLDKQENLDEQSREYVEVLERQSARLKKLLEDLIEASKAATGNLAVTLEPCDLGVLLDQAVGEYAERMQAARLELIPSRPRQPVTVMADGKHLWRVFDNLMNNAAKYAMPGTRVYLDLSETETGAEISFRNISRERLNLTSEELLQRFVRGDSARSGGEGSGLGLSIAQSLTQLMGGSLELTVDGDLFKAVVRLPKA